MKKLFLGFLLIIFGCLCLQGQAPIIADHNIAKLSVLTSIPTTYINAAKANLHIAYEHTSHGQQIVQGMTGLVNWKGSLYAFNKGGTGGALDLRDHAISPWGWSDLGSIRDPNNYVYNTYDWARITRDYLNNPANSAINVVMWSWCSSVPTETYATIQRYLDEANAIERDYPHIRFVYMTGHVDQGHKAPNSNLYVRNKQIRDYCIANNKILFDFADIESYDPDGNYYADKYVSDCCNWDANGNGKTETDGGDPGLPTNGDRNWALDWQNSHTKNVDWFDCASSHSYPLNANLKAYAIWWLWARLAGWSGTNATVPTVTTTPISSIGTTTAVSGGNVTSDGGAPVTERGVCWDMSGSPALDNPHTHDGTGTGTFTSNISGLNPNSTYYVKAYATNSAGTGYGERVSFTTLQTPYLSVSTNTITVNSNAGSTGTFNISSNTTWNITSSQSWLTLSRTSGSNNATIIVTATANAKTETRTAIVTVSGTNVSNRTITVTQEAASAFLYVSKNDITIPSTANSEGKFNIISNTDWNITSSQSWLTVGVELFYSLGSQAYKTQLYSGTAPDIGAFEYMQTTASGHDSAFVTLSAEANTEYASRNAIVTVSGTGVSNRTINVIQEASQPPAGIPVYVSSQITSTTPNVIEITYDKSLANITPSTSAFTVKVNAVSKIITSVSISDTKVLLTLANDVYSGNVVTVSYTKPTLNPLQTPAGYQAESIGAQPVTNNSTIIQTKFYISPSGSDMNGIGDGTIENPWFTLNKGWSALRAGYTLFLRGGTYYYDDEQDMRNKDGTAENYIKVFAYENEKPIFRPSASYTGTVGITVEEVSYVHLKGLEICYYEQRTSDKWYNGILAADANYCIFEKLDVHHNGFGMSLGRWTAGNPVTGNLFLNCDFHHNYDPITAITTNVPYGGADGLTIRVDNPNSVNTVRGCRMYNNSDDGFDGWYNAGLLILDNCWFFNNGYREDGVTVGGDGNGLKLGPLVPEPWTGYETEHKRTVQNCLSFNNRVNGFVQNAALCVMYLYNNFAFGNGDKGFVLNNVNNIVITARNNISYKNVKGQAYFNSISILDHNTFTYNNGVNPMYSVSDADFVSIIPTGTDAPRYPDGSLPTITFLQLADGSDLIKRGVDVGLPFTGDAPDLGVRSII